jgi:hypothetical protein
MLTAISPLSKPFQHTHKLSANDLKRCEKQKEKREKDRDKVPAIRHMIHKPTFCVLTWHNDKDEKIKHKRHQLSHFKTKTETMSNLATTRMKTALNWLFLFADKKRVYSKTPWVTAKGDLCHNFTFRLAFITLTLSSKQKHDDEFIKDNMLKPFLHWLTRNYNASYVWKAETQLNANIHFHITIDTFIPWKSVRAKWNHLLAKYEYCKVFQDGTNDKGDSATQIKAIRNEKGHAKIIGGYLTKNSIEEKNYSALKNKNITMEDLLSNSSGISCSLESKKHYTRFVTGRLWGQSESLSNVDVSLSDCDSGFQLAEQDFFRKNDVRNLGRIMFNEEKEKHKHKSENEKYSFGYDDVSLKKKYSSFFNVFIHPHLKFAKLPVELSNVLLQEKTKRNFNLQRSFTIKALF